MRAIRLYLRTVRSIRCVVRLGPWQAFKLLVLAPRISRRFQIQVPGFAQSISIRGKTSDAWVLNEVVVRRQYAGFGPETPSRILDAGANIGAATLVWNQQFPNAEIVAIEPDDDNFDMLVQNTRHLEKVSRVHGGLWSRPTRLSVHQANAGKFEIRVVEDPNGSVEAYSVPSIMARMGWDWVDIVKLDVEGSEVPILAERTAEWINKIGTLIVEIHQDIAPDAARVLFKAFAEQDFRLHWRGENLVLTQKPTKPAVQAEYVDRASLSRGNGGPP